MTKKAAILLAILFALVMAGFHDGGGGGFRTAATWTSDQDARFAR